MKINVGPQARVIGTKKVSAQGTIGGLKDHAGKDLLLVAPTRTPRYGPSWDDLWVQVRDEALGLGRAAMQEARGMGRAALHEYRAMRRRYLAKETRAAQRLAEVAPVRARAPIRKADAWVRAEALRVEKRLDRLLRN